MEPTGKPPLAPTPTKPTPSSVASTPPPVHPSAKRALPSSTKTKRTKRTKYGENRSTVTTTTATAATPVNVYDAVLGEANDLLHAAQEAQALGRLKMASAYQLLLHARLIGLGKRFDRAQVQGDGPDSKTSTPQSLASSAGGATPSPAATPDHATPTPLRELARILPEHVEMDSAMMEHLARAAMELHHQRTGRKIQSDVEKQKSTSKTPPPATTTTLAWTRAEQSKCQELLSKGTKDASVIAKELGSKTEAQVKAYLRNAKERQKGAKIIQAEIMGDDDTPRKKGRGRKPPTTAMNTVPNAKLDIKLLLQGKGLASPSNDNDCNP